MSAATDADGPALRCPSAQPGMADAQVLGVVCADAHEPRVAYLNEHVPATPEILAQAAPAAPGQVFRLAARCEEARCTHFDGKRCRLAMRIVEMLPPVVDGLPPCTIRKSCRWFHEEGRAACLRCPQVVTVPGRDDAQTRSIAGMPMDHTGFASSA